MLFGRFEEMLAGLNGEMGLELEAIFVFLVEICEPFPQKRKVVFRFFGIFANFIPDFASAEGGKDKTIDMLVFLAYKEFLISHFLLNCVQKFE